MAAAWGRFGDALTDIDRAIALYPNNTGVLVSKARVLNTMGRAAEAEESARLAMRLNPHHPPEVLRVLARSLLHQGRYEEAAATFERVIELQPNNAYDQASLAVACGHLGRAEEAGAAVAKYDEIYGEYNYTPMTVQEIGWWWYSDMYDYHKPYRDDLRDGLRKAGVPEGSAPWAADFDFEARVHKSGGLYTVESTERIDEMTAKALYDRGVAFIDVRDVGSFARGHIPGAVHLDLNLEFTEENLAQHVGRDDEVVIHCLGEACSWSAYASAKAVLWGFKRVYYFNGGLPAWKDAGYPTESSAGY